MRPRSVAWLTILAALAALACAAPSARADDPSLLLRWHLDDTGSATVKDNVNAANDGTAFGAAAPISDGRFEEGYTFASGGKVRIDTRPDLQPAQLTLQAWVRGTGNLSNGQNRHIVGLTGGTSCLSRYAIATDADGTLHFVTQTASGVASSPGVSVANAWDGHWHAVTGTYDGAKVHLYFDGREVGTGTTAGAIDYTGASAFAAGSPDAPCAPQQYTGDLDEVHLYGRVLTPTEIAYTQGPAVGAYPSVMPMYPGAGRVIAKYHLDSQSGGTTPDAGPHGLPGINVAATTVAGKFGNAFSFPSANNGFQVTDSPLLRTHDLSALAWIKNSGSPGGNRVIMAVGGGSCTPVWELQTTPDGTGLQFLVGTYTDDSFAYLPINKSPPNLWDGNWHSVLVTYGTASDSGRGSIGMWIDGNGVGSGNQDSGFPYDEIDYDLNPQTHLTVGHLPSNSASCTDASTRFPGAIDEVQLYDRDLSNELSNAISLPDPPSPPSPGPEPADEPEPGLVLKWHLDSQARPQPQGPPPPYMTADQSGLGNDGTIDTGTLITGGRFQNAFSFPAPDPGKPAGIGSFATQSLEPAKVSLVAWLRARHDQVYDAGDTPEVSVPVTYGGNATTCGVGAYGFQVNGDNVTFKADTGPGGLAQTSDDGLADGEWHQFVGTFDGTRLRIYRDGQPFSAGPADGLVNGPDLRYTELTARGLRIGGQADPSCFAGQSLRFPGDIDEVRVYNRALSDSEIAYLARDDVRTPPKLPIQSDPQVTSRPTLTGVPKVGSVLTCHPGTYSGSTITTRDYLWEKAPRTTKSQGDSSWQAISGATGTTYTVQAGDPPNRVRCREVVTNATGTDESVSTSLRTDADVPVNAVQPVVRDEHGLVVAPLQAGNRYTCDPGTWANFPDFTYTWLRDGVPIPGATGSTYIVQGSRVGTQLLPQDGDGDHFISCSVTASNDVGTGAAATSEHVYAITGTPIDTTDPTLTLDNQNDPNELNWRARCTPGHFLDNVLANGLGGYAYHYQWARNGIDIPGANDGTFNVDVDTLGRDLTCRAQLQADDGTLYGTRTSAKFFVPIPTSTQSSGTPGGILRVIHRTNDFDPVNALAVSNAYLDAAKDIFRSHQVAAMNAMRDACYQGRWGNTFIRQPQDFVTEVKSWLPTIGNQVLSDAQRCEVLSMGIPFYKNGDHPSGVPDWFFKTPVLSYSDDGVRWLHGQSPDCGSAGISVLKPKNCPLIQIPIQPVDAKSQPLLTDDEQSKLTPVTPVRVLWDLDGNGRTDIDCPGTSPVVRAVLPPGSTYPNLNATIVNPVGASVPQFVHLKVATPVVIPNSAPNGAKVSNRSADTPMPMWCRSSVIPPPDPVQGQCASQGDIGRVHVEGNLCPLDVRGLSTDEIAGLGDDGGLRDVVVQAAAVANEADKTQDRTYPGFSENLTRRSLSLRINPFPSTVDQVVAQTQTDINATVSNATAAAQQAANNTLTPYEQKLRDATKPLVTNPAATSAFSLDQMYIANGDMKVNGVDFSPVTGKRPMLIPSDAANGIPGMPKDMVFHAPDVDTIVDQYKLAAQKDVEKQFKDGLNQAKTAAEDELQKVDLSQLQSLIDVGPFKLAKTADVKIEIQDDRSVIIRAKASIPALSLDVPVVLKADASGHLILQSIKMHVGGAKIGGLGGAGVQDLNIDYEPNTTGLEASGKLSFPGAGQLDITGLRFSKGGDFGGLTLAYSPPAGTGIPIAPGVFLVSLKGGFGVRPIAPHTGITAGGAISMLSPGTGNGCPTLGVNAGLSIYWDPIWEFHADGNANIACISPLDMHVDGYEDGRADVTAHFGFDADPLANADINLQGKVQTSNGGRPAAWQVGLDGRAKVLSGLVDAIGSIFGDDDFASVHVAGVLGNKGLAVCGSIGKLGGGVALAFTNGIPPFTQVQLFEATSFFAGCNLGPYESITTRIVRQTASGSTTTFTMRKAGAHAALKLQGAGSSPHPLLTSPSGKVYDFSKATVGQKLADGSFDMTNERNDETFVWITKPEPGQWTVTSSGAPTVRVRQAAVLPAVKATGKVTGHSARRTLTYNVRKLAGQEVRLVEDAPGYGGQTLKVLGTGGKGKLRFDVSEATGSKRSVVAQIVQNGIPRANVTMARFTAPSPKVGRPRVKIRRRGKQTLVTWSRAALAKRYEVSTSAAGSNRSFFARKAGQKRSLAIPGAGKKAAATASVVAYSPIGRAGRAGTARIKAVKAKKHKKKHKKRAHRKHKKH